MELISKDSLYQKIASFEEMHRTKLLEMDVNNPNYQTQNRLLSVISTIKYAVADEPQVDAVEVVRCKDCKHAERYTWSEVFCHKHQIMKNENGYCDLGDY